MEIVVTGMALRCAAGANSYEVFDRLGQTRDELAKKSLQYPIFSINDAFFPHGRSSSAKDTLFLAECVAKEAIDLAHLCETDLQEASLVLGTTEGCSLHFIQSYANLRKNQPLPAENDLAAYMSSNLALQLSPPIHGIRLTISDTCTTGVDALALGCDLIRSGQSSCVLCGGVDTVGLVAHTGFSRLLIYDPALCRPFDRDRAGLTLGEGAALVVLEEGSRARRRCAPILGYIVGYAQASDCYHVTSPDPEGSGLCAAISGALSMGGIEAKDLAFVNAHATATKENDFVEGRVLQKMLPHVPVWASKGSTGHTLAAAGALEGILTLVALQKGRIPKSYGFSHVDPTLCVYPTQCEQAIRSPYALSCSVGFGGGNAAVVLRKDGL